MVAIETFDYEKQELEHTKQPVGIERLYRWHDEHSPASNLVNSAMTMEVCLRHTRDAITTGRGDVLILGTPSQELLTDLILDMPIGVRNPTPMGTQLFYELINETSSDEDTMTQELIQFTRYIQSATSPYSTLEHQDRRELTLNLASYIRGLRYTAQKLVNRVMDQRSRWGHEGGDVSDLQPDIYREFINREYIRFMMSRHESNDRPGLTRQVALRMLHEAEWFERRNY